MKTFIAHLFFCLLLIQNIAAQADPFQKIFGTANENEVGVESVVQDDQYIYLLGYASNPTVGTDGTLTKLDLQGNIIWADKFGSRNDDIPSDILLNDKGEIVLIGETLADNATKIDPFIYVFDTTGRESWSETYGTASKNEFFKHIEQTEDGGYIICGFITGQGFGNDYYIVKTDAAGVIEWEKTYGGETNETGVSILPLEDQSYLMIGDKQQSDQGPYGIEAFRLNASGEIIWQTDINDFDNGGCKSMTRNKSGNFLIIGEATPPGEIAFDVFLAELSPDGQVLWQKFVDASSRSDAGFGIVELSDASGYMMTGYGHNESTNNSDMIIAQIDSEGNEIERTYIERTGTSIGYDIKLIGSNAFLATGFDNELGDSQYILNLEKLLVSSTEAVEKQKPAIRLFPNPMAVSQNNIQIQPTLKNAIVRLYNPNGQKLLEQHYDDLSSFSLLNFPAALYYLSIQTPNTILTEKIIRF